MNIRTPYVTPPRVFKLSQEDAKTRKKKSSVSSSASENVLQPKKIQASQKFSVRMPPSVDDTEIPSSKTYAAMQSNNRGLMTASMLEKLKERLESDDIKPLVTSDSSSQDTASIGRTVSTMSTKVTAADTVTEVLPADEDCGGVGSLDLDHGPTAWQEGRL